MDRIEQAVILAAGEGQRLRPFTALKPKVLIPIANKPILQYVVEALASNGVRNILMVVGYRKEQVQDFFGSGKDFGVAIDYVVQSQQLGTGHALKQAQGRMEDSFLVASGDNIIDAAAIAGFLGAKPNALLIKEQRDVSKYGVVMVKDGVVEDLVEKPRDPTTRFVNTGVYLFTREIFEFVKEEIDLTSALRKIIQQGHKINAHETDATWLDVVYPWDILKLNDTVLKGISPSLGGTIEGGVTLKGPVSIGRNTVIRSNSYIVGPVIIGENCEIGPSAYISPATSIGDSVLISPFSEIKNSVIGDHVEIGASSTIEDSVIDKGCVLKGHFTSQSGEAEVRVEDEYHQVKIGAMVGEYCFIESGVIVYPGIFIGNCSKVKAMKVLTENIPDEALVV